MKTSKKWMGYFRFSTKFVIGLLFLAGALLIWIGFDKFEVDSMQREVFVSLGETAISTALLSLLLELHSIQKYYKQIRDSLFLEDPSFISRYSDSEATRILQLAIMQKIQLYGRKHRHRISYDEVSKLIFSSSPLAIPYIDNTAKLLGEKGFYCKNHVRQINITPISNWEYRINIVAYLELINLTDQDIKCEQAYNFYYISQEQIDSFKLLSLQIGSRLIADNLSTELKYKKYSGQNPSTSRHPFNFFVEFHVPIKIPAHSSMQYTLSYEYKNFEQACYITYALPYITESFRETYSLTGSHASEYQIHATAYTPYKHQLDENPLVHRENDLTLSISSNKWIVPGSGFVAIVRKIRSPED